MTRLQRRARAGLAILLGATLVAVSGCAAIGAATPAPSGGTIVVGSVLYGKPAPQFDLVDLQGRHVRLSDYAGRPVIVNFWASWCIPCQQEFPLYRNVLAEYGTHGLEVLGVVYQDSAAKARAFMASHDATWPALVDPGGRVAAAYGVLGIPMSFFVDRHGVVRAVSYGPPPAQALQQDLELIL